MKEKLEKKIRHNLERFIRVVKWIVYSFITGIILGVTGAAFARCITEVTVIRKAHPWLLALLPVGAVGIVFLYHLLKNEEDGGTNSVIATIHGEAEVPLRTAPLIFVSTVFSHLCGASVGREGAALQMGGSIGNAVGRLFRFEQNDKNTMIMCGMSAVFSAMFGTPMAAAIFSMEVVSVGIMHYAALVPCVISAFVARRMADLLGVKTPFYEIEFIPDFTLKNALIVVAVAIVCGLVSIVFCMLLHRGGRLVRTKIENPYLRALIGGTLVLGMTLLVGSQTYNGTGVDYIRMCMDGDSHMGGFFVKIVFTVISLIAGYRGGEIVPSFFIGASLGCTLGRIIGFAPSMCAAIGMGAVFCGVTNCPITSFIICMELFGFEAAPFFMLAVAISYMVSGYYGLYQSQKIIYSKYRSNYINTHTK